MPDIVTTRIFADGEKNITEPTMSSAMVWMRNPLLLSSP